ncbi:hypothetical protein IKQ21_02320 [bacterium]|nr:hypothetical protein [bacterium]
MLSKYFEYKTNSQKFEEEINSLISELKDKRVLIYGAGEGFLALNKKYSFASALNITGISDKKFENTSGEMFEGMRAIAPENIPNEEFDTIIVSNEKSKEIVKFLQNKLDIDEEKIKTLFVEEIPDEQTNYNYLYEYNFDKTLPKTVKKLKNKTVILYGAGAFLELIKKHFDLTGINIIGISDRRFVNHEENEEFLGYKAYAPSEIAEVKPDCVLVATKFYINIIEELYYKTLKGAKIKILPLVRKPLWTLIREIWG